MTFFISPSVSVTETDATLAVVEQSGAIGGLAGVAQWGPVDVPTLITGGEDDQVARFGKPNSDTYLSFFVLADYLGYSQTAYFIRSVGAAAKNAVSSGQTALLIKNSDDYVDAPLSGISFVAKYPGVLGNGVVIDVADSATFPSWEFRGSFDYAPLAGEFAVAVVDSAGVISGVGEAKQTERLVVNGPASGGIKEVRAIVFSGNVVAGTKQEENLTVTGTSTGTTITVDGVAVTIANGDTAAQAATKIATALTATTNYTSAVATGAVIDLIRKNPGLVAKVADATGSGISVTSAIVVPGNDTEIAVISGESLTIVNGQAATAVASSFFTSASANSLYSAVVKTNATTVTVTYAAFGSQGSASAATVKGITTTPTISTVGSSAISISVYGKTVALVDGDSSSVVAGKIAVKLTEITTFEQVAATGANVYYTHTTVGAVAAQAVPATQAGIIFEVDVTTTGRLGTLLEKYELQTNNKTDRNADGSSQYFVDNINRKSVWVNVGDTTIPLTRKTVKLAGGVDDNTGVNITNGVQMLADSEQYDLNYLIAGGVSTQEQKATSDVADTRRDCLAFVSPQFDDVVNNKGNEVAAIKDWSTIEFNRESSYTVKDSNWAYVYDKYNDVFRWIPTCGGTAGLHARTANDFDPWIPAAGHQRGQYKSYVKLAWSPNKGQRDELYKVSVNPVVNFPNEGILLYGDKTSISRPSAFGHINVRSAFIVAEKSIANFSKQYLFEVNDEFTRASFLNAVRPFMRNMIARRAFEDVRIVVNEKNNDGAIRAENKMVADFYIKPLYSINYIILNFTAVRPDVSFDEIENLL